MIYSYWLPVLLELVWHWSFLLSMESRKQHSTNQQLLSPQRVKRSWVWNQFFVLEEQTLTKPLSVGQLRSDSDKQDGSYQYRLSGEGAGNIFTIDENTGTIYVVKKLDREKKSSYTLRAQAINKYTGLPVEPESEFIIKVQDINDNRPQFLNEPYVASIPEMSPEGTSVIQVTATDLDDPTYGNNARLIYSILQGQPYFSVEPKTGIIRMASQMDRETNDQHLVVVQVRDMVGLTGEFSTTTTVTINLLDVNDNVPKFQLKLYHLSFWENTPVGAYIGTIMADDSDIGENAEMDYIIEGNPSTFGIITNNLTQEGLIILKQSVDYETKTMYSIRVKAINKHIDERFLNLGPFEDTTIVKISVEDVNEPPVFLLPEYKMEVLEGATRGSYVGAVSARDPDKENISVRYSLIHSKHLSRLFNIDEHNGTITVIKPLDREVMPWCNLTVKATEASNSNQVSKVPVYIQVLDINDNAPEFPENYKTYVCETVKQGSLIKTISAVDKDNPVEGHHFYFTLAPEDINNSNFTIRDNQDNTASVLTRRNGFSQEEQTVFYLQILIADNGTPSLSSTNTLTIAVCNCDEDGNAQSCKHGGFGFFLGFSTAASIAVLTCFFILLVLVLLVLAIRKRRKSSLFSEKKEDFRENIVRYDDEGGGEEDTKAFDMAALRTQTVLRKHKPRRGITTQIQSIYRMSLGLGPDEAEFRKFITEKLKEANTDPCAPPFDCLQTYAFEGTGSIASSLSSLESVSCDMDKNYAYLKEWGPCFRKLANMYGYSETGEDQ
ncbi:LOW QUALITY PROTEIN: cadherin-19 [Microcaecilia unicolor]|uniref:LOW QUALITY PROTEIN: cadherin-19 n=1 Tax=Microcaecilia unicolor TaxID=1415580 RepID=A0A6P7YYW7_9AMPH|nr:LOW QUALITY PROTEIN: cadherin-19 [Microcaecilia unicolor]